MPKDLGLGETTAVVGSKALLLKLATLKSKLDQSKFIITDVFCRPFNFHELQEFYFQVFSSAWQRGHVEECMNSLWIFNNTTSEILETLEGQSHDREHYQQPASERVDRTLVRHSTSCPDCKYNFFALLMLHRPSPHEPECLTHLKVFCT